MRSSRTWVGMKAVDKKVGPPPCKKDGVDCSERHPACQGKCQKYIDWRNRRLDGRQAYYEQFGGEVEHDKYVMYSFNKMQLKKGKKVKER